ncbi:hypothetical protein BKG96_06670 [Rodentibacter caecimuris]|uniref:Uncharacterized protein n=1 Tax=Rodentibacter caecimuris TaxID=1796644 RepID=A0A1V3KKI6_9PAST|nr:hypothetical protein [Rodentibacter heylii]OOF78171.1 hypothetical protein BKG96_06670 [Rodentibacter heylii]
MKLTTEQEKQLLEVYKTAKEKNSFVETSKADIQQRAKLKRTAYLHNKRIIDEVFYGEMANA